MPNVLKGAKVLVVDDSVVQRNHVIDACRALGVGTVEGAVNGQDALVKVREQTFDLLFIDLEMPVMDGVDLVQALASEHLVQSVIILSSKDPVLILNVGTMAEADGLTVLGTFKKPILEDQLNCALERLGERKWAGHADIEGPTLRANDLLTAIESGHIEAFYQPKLLIKGLILKGVEALARWRHPEHGLISPALFIPMAERFGLIDKLTDHMFDLALQQKKRWQAQGLRLDLAFNLSPLSISNPGLAEHVSEMVKKHDLNPEEIILEITENALANEISLATGSLAKLRLGGFRVAIDDYGIGFANAQQLSRVPATELKLDRSMVDHVATRPQNQSIVRSTLQMAKELGLSTTAEGVENESDLAFLAQEGVDQLQGFLLAKPMPAEDLNKWLKVELTGLRKRLLPALQK